MRLIKPIPWSGKTSGLWDLKVVVMVGTFGFKRSEIYRSGKWGPETEFWVDNDATSVDFYRLSSSGVKNQTLIQSIKLDTKTSTD
jgi:hypothetical protein